MVKKTSPVNETIKKNHQRRRAKSIPPESYSLAQQLAQREAELEIINSIQQGLAAELDFQAIVDLVGDKLRKVFKTPDLSINWYDEKANLIHPLYVYEHDKRLSIAPYEPIRGNTPFEKMSRTLQPIVLNNAEDYLKMNAETEPGTDQSKSLVSIPIISGDRLLGNIQLENYEQENAFGEPETRLLTTIAASLGTALENARLFDETQRLFKAEQERVAELQIINSIQQGLASKLDFASIIDLVGEQVRTTTKAQSIFIALYDKSSGLVSCPYWVANGERIPNSIEPLRKNITRRVLFATAPLNLGTEREILEHDAIPPEGYTVGKSFLGVPFSVGNAMLGALSIHALEQEHAFTESDERLLQTIANAMSVALENARLFDETQRLFKAEQERVAELQIINSIQQGLAAELDFQAIIDLVGDKLSEVLHTGDLGIRWYDEKTGLIHHLYEFEHGERLTIPPLQPKPGGVFETMTKTRQPIVMTNVEDYVKWNLPIHPGTDQSKSAVYIPIISSDRVFGFITLENYERENAFGESELRLLTTIAASLGTALENARLFDETQRLLKEQNSATQSSRLSIACSRG